MTTDRVMQSLWVGGRLSTMGRLGLQSFLANGHEFHLYCYDFVDGTPPGTVIRDAGEILPRNRVFAYRSGFGAGSYSAGSNLFRYKLLLDRGGWWVDTDVVCLQPFDFPAVGILASENAKPEEGGGVRAASNVIKQPAGSAIMRWAWRTSRQKDPDRVQWGDVGPLLLHEGVQTLGWQDDMCPVTVFNPVPFVDWGAFIDPDRTFAFGPDVYAVHLWHQMWRENGADPDGRFPDACLYEQLKRRYLDG